LRRAACDASAPWVPAAVLLAVVAACFAWPLTGTVPAPVGGDIAAAGLPSFSPGHLLGTDPIGNDVLARLLYGGRVALEVALASNVLGLVLGGAIGIAAGIAGGGADAVAARLLDVLIAVPALVLALLIAASLGPGETHVIAALAFFTVPAYARLARAQTRRIRELDFVVAARLAGTGELRIAVSHIAVNVAGHLLTFAFVGVSLSITFQAALSFLGLGVVPPQPSWGDMIATGQEYLTTDPALALIPSAALVVTVVALNALGDALRDRLVAS
jgi:peptide/nickel transport system permease protein